MEKVRNLAQLLEVLRRTHNIEPQKVERRIIPTMPRRHEKSKQHFCISLAGQSIAIDSEYSEVYYLCKEYECERIPDIHISISDQDISTEQIYADNEQIPYNASYLETLAVLRKISNEILAYDTFLMHGAVIGVGNNAYMFTAKSGTGKTTHIRKWLKNIEGSYVVNGDKPFIKITDTEVIACGTPWCGKENMSTNCMVPLRAIVFMERGEKNEMREISFSEGFPYLFQQTYQPDNEEKMKKTLKLISGMKGKVRLYRYIFDNMQDDAFDVSYGTLTGDMT